MTYSVVLTEGKNLELKGIPALPEHTIEEIKRELTVSNPEYARRERLGLYLGNTPEKFALWERVGDVYRIPYGAKSFIESVISKSSPKPVVYTYHSKYGAPAVACQYKSNINLYDYQHEAWYRAMMEGRGIIVAPCGSGKTQIGLQIAAGIGAKTLWLTHTHDLLNQSMKRAKECFDMPHSAFGTITSGKVDIGEVITFATVQTMAKLDLSQYENEWDCIIVDECHHVAGSPTKVMQFSKVLGSLCARHKFGLTATPKRPDGLTKCMFAYLGPKVWEIKKEDVGDKTVPVLVKMYGTGWDCDIDDMTNPDGTLNYTKLINKVCDDNDRNSKIISALDDIFAEDPTAKVLVLSERVSHLNILRRLAHRISIIITGGTPKQERKRNIDVFSRLSSGAIMFATYQLAKEGLDIPALTHIVMASPIKTDTTIIQSAGRVARACIGKEYGVVVDFVDDFLPLDRWAQKRARIYRRLE